MNTLRDQIKDSIGQAELARRFGITTAAVSQWFTENGPGAPIERCAQIELYTGHQVRRWDLRPGDWYLIWPELIGTEGAPAVPALEKKAA